jgi:hypothetical protein
LGLPKFKLTPYNLRMVNQITIKLVGLIRDLKIYVHGIPYIITFIVCRNPTFGLATKARVYNGAGQD